MDSYNEASAAAMGGTMIIFIVIMVFWSLFWKGMALWKAARNSDKSWYVFLLIFNTAGILEILYLYVFSKKSADVKPAEQPKQ